MPKLPQSAERFDAWRGAGESGENKNVKKDSETQFSEIPNVDFPPKYQIHPLSTPFIAVAILHRM